MLPARRAAFFPLIAIALLMVVMLLMSRFLPVVDFITRLQQRVGDLGRWSAICYPLLFAACNVLLLPGGILAVGAGFFFGLWWGFLVVLIGNSIGAAVSFGLSRWL